MSIDALKQWADEKALSNVVLSDDGTTLSLNGKTVEANSVVTLSHGGKSISYSMASLFLQILDPNQGLVSYRNACKKYHVKDYVKALDKPTVIGYFLPSEAGSGTSAPPPGESFPAVNEDTAAAPPATTSVRPDEAKRPSTSSRQRPHDKHKDRQRKRSHSSDKHAHQKKVAREPLVTQEQIFSNLRGVVDKRTHPSSKDPDGKDEEEHDEEYELIKKALCPAGFQVTPELLDEHRGNAKTLFGSEIPVGNSASILRAAKMGTDLSRVLTLLQEVSGHKSSSTGKSSSPVPPRRKSNLHLIGKKPVILVPKGMTAPITMINAFEFFSNARFVPRDTVIKTKAFIKSTTFTHKIPSLGPCEFELLDNPRKLESREDWQRVVAVIVLGHAWQFKDWPGEYSNPVHLFDKAFGFYIGMEGAVIPKDMEGWACKRGKLHRDKRGLDSSTFATFWNSLESWMKIHKPELLPQSES